MKKIKETGKCCICGNEYAHYGNDAMPAMNGRCCDKCNNDIVVPLRIYGMAALTPEIARTLLVARGRNK